MSAAPSLRAALLLQRADLLRELEDLSRQLEISVFCWISSLFCFSPCWTSAHSAFASSWRRSSARFWLMSRNVDRKIASSETSIVRRPYGKRSTPRPIHAANHTTCRNTKLIEPANRVIESASRSWIRDFR